MKRFRLPDESGLSQKRKVIFALVVLPILILTIYSNTFQSSWHMDDSVNILQNRQLHLKSLTWNSIKHTFFAHPNQKGKFFRPIACVSFALNYYMGGLNVFGYHLVNILIHMVSAAFLFLFIYNTLSLPLVNGKKVLNAYAVALLATLFWASHPIQTQAVTYIVQRMASMAGMFYIMSMYFYLKGRTAIGWRRKTLFFACCLFSGLMAVGCKENAIMLPMSIYLFDLLLIQGVSKNVLRKNVKIVLAVLLLTLFTGMIYYVFSQKDDPVFHRYGFRAFTLGQRLLTEPGVILLYLSLIFYPVSIRFSIDHDVPICEGLLNPPTALISLLILTALVILGLALAKRRPLIAFSILFFFLNHLIESTILPLELVFEHRNYIPSMFLFIPVAYFLLHAMDHPSLRRSVRTLVAFFIIGILVFLGHATYIRNALWKTDESLWMAATERAPNLWRPWHNLGNYYSKNNRRQEAFACYFRALSKKTNIDRRDKHLTLYNIGVLHQQAGRTDMALDYYMKAKKLNPRFVNTRNNLGGLLVEKGQFLDAERELRKAIHLKKNHAQAQGNLGFLLLSLGKTKEAVKHLEKALSLSPNDAFTLKRLGYAYKSIGSYGRALLSYQASYAHNPHDRMLLLHMAEIYFLQGMNFKANREMGRFLDAANHGDILALLEDIDPHEMDPYKMPLGKDMLKRLLPEIPKRNASLVSRIETILESMADGR